MIDVRAQLTLLVVSHLGVEEEKVNDAATLAGDLGADSLDIVELVMAVEDDLKIEISDDEAVKVDTFGDLVILAEGKLSTAEPRGRERDSIPHSYRVEGENFID